MHRGIFLFSLVLASTAIAAEPAVEKARARAPEPPAESQKEAEKKVRAVHRSDYASRTPQAMRVLAAKLLSEGSKIGGDPDWTYACLREARDLAVQAGDPRTGLAAVAEIARAFEVNAAAMRRSVLSALVRAVKSPEDFRLLAVGCMASAVESIEAGETDGARKMASAAGAAAKAARDAALAACARDLAAEVAEVAGWQERAMAAEKRLAEAPDDPAANLTLGKFLCLYRRDWARGLPHLARGSDPALLKLADEDRAGASSPGLQMTVAKGWQDLVPKAQGIEKASLLLRSGYWYARAARDATSDVREAALVALEAIAAQAPDPRPPLPGSEPPPGLVIARFNGQDLRGWEVLNGTWRAQGGNLTSTGGNENRFLRSWGQTRWLRLLFEFQGGNPGIYFAASSTADRGPGFNLDAEARNNGEIRTAVDMQAWNSVQVDFERNAMRVLLNGREVYSGFGGAPTCLLLKAQRGELRVRKLTAVGWNPDA
jgi:hypothetical protein